MNRPARIKRTHFDIKILSRLKLAIVGKLSSFKAIRSENIYELALNELCMRERLFHIFVSDFCAFFIRGGKIIFLFVQNEPERVEKRREKLDLTLKFALAFESKFKSLEYFS